MNPIDHPHGGGEGRTGEGRVPVSPWGQPTKGYRTRQQQAHEQHDRAAPLQAIRGRQMTRSLKKGSVCRRTTWWPRWIRLVTTNDKKPIKTWSRRSTVLPDFIGLTIAVHNGQAAHSGLCFRKDGGPQAGRVRADPYVQGSHRQDKKVQKK
jgi:hypothetical protein